MNNFVAALQVMDENNWEYEPDTLIGHRRNPEEGTIFKDLTERLSEEAKSVLKAIFMSPQEIAFAITTPKNPETLTFNKLYTLLRSKGWRHKKILQVKKEIQKYIREAY